jgi:hypothetical protein
MREREGEREKERERERKRESAQILCKKGPEKKVLEIYTRRTSYDMKWMSLYFELHQ